MKKQPVRPIVYEDLAPYTDPKYGWNYEFPIEYMHPRLGRLEVHIELVKTPAKPKAGRLGRFSWLILGFSQTDDPRYEGKFFKIPLPEAEGISSFRKGNGDCTGGFLESIWRVSYCTYHKQTCLQAYAPDESKFLRISHISAMSSSTNIWFRSGRK